MKIVYYTKNHLINQFLIVGHGRLKFGVGYLHLDFLGPFLNKQFLVLLDAHSKWIEIFPMNNITTSLTIEILRSCFARFGLPRQIVTDNAPRGYFLF